MRRLAYLLCLVAVLSDGGLSAAPQQDEPTYRVQSEVAIAGTVTKVSVHIAGQRGTPRARATLRLSDGSTREIHVGPSSFVKDKGMVLAVGDHVSVIGSQVMSDGAPLVIVRRLTRGNQILDLRDASGRRIWEDRYR